MSRPRRSLLPKSYALPSSDEESDAEVVGSGFNSLSEDSNFSDAPDEQLSEAEESKPFVAKQSPEPSAASAVFQTLLTSSQITQTRAIIAEQSAGVSKLQAKYELHTELAAEYKLKLKAAQDALAENNARIAPIIRVPAEVLGFIFTIHVHDNRQSPWLLMKISRAWRATSLLTRVIWRGIMLVPADWTLAWSRRLARDEDGLQVCTNVSQLRNALARAGSVSLDLRVTGVPPPESSNFLPPRRITEYKSDISKLLDCIRSQLKLPRIRSLEISTGGFKLPPDSFHRFSFADMECFTLNTNYPMLVVKMAEESTQVHTLNIPTTSLKNLKPIKRFNWAHMVHLTLSHVCGDTDFDIGPMLAATSNLVSLSFVGDAVQSLDPEDDTQLELPSLRRLSMRHSATFWPIHCHNLTHLTLQLPSEMEAPPDHSISLLYLVELVFITGDSSTGALRAFKVPLLQKLSLTRSDGKAVSAKGVKELWPIQSGVPAGRRGVLADFEARSIELSHFSINPKLLARTLNERPSLEELMTDEVLVDAEFFNALAPVRSKKGKGSKGNGKGDTKAKKLSGVKRGWDLGCPELKRLVIDLGFRRGKPKDEDDILKSAKSLVVERSKVNAPLERLAIRLGRFEDWKELV